MGNVQSQKEHHQQKISWKMGPNGRLVPGVKHAPRQKQQQQPKKWSLWNVDPATFDTYNEAERRLQGGSIKRNREVKAFAEGKRKK